MKILVTIFTLLVTTSVKSQICNCDSDSLLSERIDCNKIIFSNKAKLFWSYNCDSSWLTFESASKRKRIIFSLGDGLQVYTGRLGHIYLEEFKNTFLIQNNVISGCCSPPEYYIYNKTNGKLLENTGRLLFYSENKNLPILISVTNSSYSNRGGIGYNSLTIYNVDNNKKYYLKLPLKEIEKALKENDSMYPEDLISTELKGTIVEISYYLVKPKEKGTTKSRTIKINLKKYSG